MDNERIAKLEVRCERIPHIEAKVDKLLEFKWKLIGMSVLGAFVATLLVEAIR